MESRGKVSRMNGDGSPVVARRRLLKDLHSADATRAAITTLGIAACVIAAGTGGAADENTTQGLTWSRSKWVRIDQATVTPEVCRLIAIELTLLIVSILAALSRISKSPPFALRVIMVCLKHGHRQEPSDYSFPLVSPIGQGMPATIT